VASLNSKHRAPLAADLESDDGQQFDTDRERYAIAIRDLDGGMGHRLRRWVHDRLGRQLAKFAPQIERVDVRFGDVHGPKGGVDRSCMVHVILSGLPPVIAEAVGETHQHAFDQAAGRAARATGHNLARHGFSTGHKRRSRPATRPVRDERAPAAVDLSSRRSSNRSTPDNGLTVRTKSAVSSPKSKAARSAGRRH
jgi:hypothetical protein